jgi:MFS family permease
MNGGTTTTPTETAPPAVLFWFKIYTGALTALYLLCVLASPVLFVIGMRTHSDERVVALVYGVILLAVGLPFAVACALPFILPRKPWVWVYNLIIICIGMTSCCILPASVALLIYWIKPDVKLWFNRT